jgi:hypothetical protein
VAVTVAAVTVAAVTVAAVTAEDPSGLRIPSLPADIHPQHTWFSFVNKRIRSRLPLLQTAAFFFLRRRVVSRRTFKEGV